MKTVPRFRTPLDFVDRRWERTYMSFETTIIAYDRLCLPVRVVNLSAGGFLLESAHPIKPGDGVVIELQGVGSVSGRIIWAKNGRAGGQFDTTVGIADLIRAVDEQDQQMIVRLADLDVAESVTRR